MRTLMAMSAGDPYDYPSPAVRRRADLELAADRLRALPHGHHSEPAAVPAGRGRCNPQPDAVVRYGQCVFIVSPPECDAHAAGVSVLRDVVEGLLHDPEERNLARLRQTTRLLVALHDYLDPGATRKLARIPLQRRQQAVIVEHW